ncbi:MAG: hypothetical protein WB573_11530 [Terracidiphilus sp.]
MRDRFSTRPAPPYDNLPLCFSLMCFRPQVQIVSSTGARVIPYSEMEYHTHGGTVFAWRRTNIPSPTSSCRCRISIRSVIPGMLRLNSLVRIGPSVKRHRMVPFQRPSITDSMASIGHSEISFFDTGMSGSALLSTILTDNFVSTTN